MSYKDYKDWREGLKEADLPHRYKIISNKIRCKKCGDIIESRYRHEMVWCRCGQCAVDGGTAYLKRCFYPEDPAEAFEELSEVENE